MEQHLERLDGLAQLIQQPALEPDPVLAPTTHRGVELMATAVAMVLFVAAIGLAFALTPGE